MSMNIWAGKGDKVRYSGKNGYDSARERASKVFFVDQVLTIDRVEVDNSSTAVYFTEIPGQSFNSVMFEDVEINIDNAVDRAYDWYPKKYAMTKENIRKNMTEVPEFVKNRKEN